MVQIYKNMAISTNIICEIFRLENIVVPIYNKAINKNKATNERASTLITQYRVYTSRINRYTDYTKYNQRTVNKNGGKHDDR